MHGTNFRGNFLQRLRGLARWFQPGIGVKRWFLLVLLGITMLGVGLALFLLEIFRTQSSNDLFLSFLFYASLSFLPRELRILIFTGIGAGLIFALHPRYAPQLGVEYRWLFFPGTDPLTDLTFTMGFIFFL